MVNKSLSFHMKISGLMLVFLMSLIFLISQAIPVSGLSEADCKLLYDKGVPEYQECLDLAEPGSSTTFTEADCKKLFDIGIPEYKDCLDQAEPASSATSSLDRTDCKLIYEFGSDEYNTCVARIPTTGSSSSTPDDPRNAEDQNPDSSSFTEETAPDPTAQDLFIDPGQASGTEDCSGVDIAIAVGCDDSQSNPIFAYATAIINFLGMGVGLVVTIMIAIGGIQYMTAGGNPQKTQAAIKRIIDALIGLVMFIFLYAFLQWLIPGGLF